MFCLRLIAKNVADVVASEIVSQLYKAWMKDMDEKKSGEREPWLGSNGKPTVKLCANLSHTYPQSRPEVGEPICTDIDARKRVVLRRL